MRSSRNRAIGWRVAIVSSAVLWAAVAWLVFAGCDDHHAGGDMFEPSVQLDVSQVKVLIQEDDPLWDCHTMGNKICGEAK